MEHEMKISSNTLRRLRSERGWPQEQLASASGVSLRTIQRVEAEGVASLNTAVSLAATFDVNLKELQETQGDSIGQQRMFRYALLFIGLAVITSAAINESGRLPGPLSDYFATVNILGVIIGLLIAIPALGSAIKHKEYIVAVLVSLGTPLVTLLVVGSIYWIVNGKSPAWLLLTFGAAGVAFLAMAVRELRRNPI